MDFPFPTSFSSFSRDSPHKNIFHEGIYSNISIKHNNFNNPIPPFSSSKDTPTKTVYDPIHGYIKFPDLMWQIIDTPQFQRLRNLKQLATIPFIYPGGNHTRFEHCLGTGHLARDLVTRCFNGLNTEDEFLINCVSIAGLCHDIGHGPFSHTFNLVLNEIGCGTEWEHEEFSGDIIRYLVDDNHIDLDAETISLVHSLISGTKRNMENQWIYQIVANKTNSIDVDKFDYICRDIYHIGIHSLSVDYSRVYNDCRIINDLICFSEKNDLTLASIFESRFSLHKKVYKHNKNLCVNTMVKDALALSNDYFRFDQAIHSAELFLQLDDNIVHTIRSFSKDPDSDVNSNPKLLKAEQIINDIYSRKLYRFIGEILLPSDVAFYPDKKEFLCNDNPKDEYYLTEEDIELEKCSYDYGNKNKNPFDNIFFYNPKVPNDCFRKLQRHSLLTPNVFREFCVKVICKDQNKVERAKKMFDIYKKKLLRQWNVKEKVNSVIVEAPEDSGIHYDKSGMTFLNAKRKNVFDNIIDDADENRSTPTKKNK